jgi:hypothetical protein
MKSKDLAKASGDSSVMTGASGVMGASRVINVKTVETLLVLITAVFGWLTESKKDEKKVIVCKDCGYWERI